MTCIEKLRRDHPEMSEFEFGLTIGGKCPSDFGYPEDPARYCKFDTDCCAECWNQEIPEDIPKHHLNSEEKETLKNASKLIYAHIGEPIAKTEKVDISEDGVEVTLKPVIKDSGNRRQFESGAVRDMQEGKGRCDLMPLEVVAELLRTSIADADPYISRIKLFQNTGKTLYLKSCLIDFGTLAPAFKGIPTMLLEVAKHFEEGAKKYGENNWQKGIPVHCYIDSAVRHYLKWLRGDKDEPHDRAFVWNLMCCIWEVDYREKKDG